MKATDNETTKRNYRYYTMPQPNTHTRALKCVLVHILLLGIILLSTGLCSANDINLLDHTNKQFININTSAIIANTEQTIEIPIYTGNNWISTPLYINVPTLNGVFSDIGVSGDIVQLGTNTARYFPGYGWWEYGTINPIEPRVGYIYLRAGADCTLLLYGTYLPKNTYNKYTIFDYNNYVGKNIIRPLRSTYYD